MDEKLRPYQCSICGTKFKLINDLESHMSAGCEDSRPNKRPRIHRPRAAPRAMQACRSCAASKTKCDNERQCKRCRKRNTPCIRPVDMEQQESSERNYLTIPSVDGAGDAMTMNPLPNDFTSSERDEGHHYQQPPDLGIIDGSVPTDEDEIRVSQKDISSDTWDLSLLHEHFNFDPPHNVSQGVDFLFSLPEIIPFDEDISRAVLTPLSISPVIAEDKSDLVRDAFKMSTGRWHPAARNFQEEMERNLSATQGTNIVIESLGPCDIQLMPDDFPLAVRDRLLAMLVTASDSRDTPRVTAAFPSCEALGLLFKSFLAFHVNSEDTWIHIPTFNINEARIELVAGIIAAGAARSSNRAVQKFGLAIHELLAIQLWKTSRIANILTRDLQFLQAYALEIHIALWSGDKRKMEKAQGALGNLVNMIRGCGYNRRSCYPSISPLPDDCDATLETKWQNWVQQESFTRLAYHIYFHCSQESLMTSVSGPLHYTELSLRFPKARSLWFATSATSWKDIFLSQFGEDLLQFSLVDCLAEVSQLRNLPSLYDSDVARLSVLYGISAMVRAYQQSHTISHPREGIVVKEGVIVEDSQHRWLLRAFESLYQLFNQHQPISQPPTTMELVLELLSLHLYASVDQMELLAGKEGYEEAQEAFAVLQRWVESREARESIWHAGRILRLIRTLPNETMTDLHCVAIYHVSICLWAYGTIIAKKTTSSNVRSGWMDLPVSHDEDVLLDGEETLKTQKWIALDSGRPVLSNHGDTESADGQSSVLALGCTARLMQMCIRTIRSKYPSRVILPPATENLCNLMHALGATTNKC